METETITVERLDFHLQYLEYYRGIKPGEACSRCNGSGYLTYGSGSTWRGGIGGSMMTMDVCSLCWGSGNRTKRWPSWRKFEELEKKIKKLESK
jgi:hypothetical protein